MDVVELVDFLKILDQFDDLQPRTISDDSGYKVVAEELLSILESSDDKVEDGSLYLQRLDFLAGYLADHPKYFEYLVREILGVTPNLHPDEIDRGA